MANMKTPLRVDLFFRVRHKKVRPLNDITLIKINESKDLLEPVPSIVVV